MSRNTILLALSVVTAALCALPAVASATPSHMSATENFTITSSETGVLETTSGEKVECHGGMSGTGSFENTTTGTIIIVFHQCTAGGVTCTTPGKPSGTIETTPLPFHLTDLGMLITPDYSQTGVAHVVTIVCFIVKREVRGNGVLGTITSPACGTPSTTANLSFAQGASTGLQQHTTYTGVNYHLEMGGVKAALSLPSAQIHFANAKSRTCT